MLFFDLYLGEILIPADRLIPSLNYKALRGNLLGDFCEYNKNMKQEKIESANGESNSFQREIKVRGEVGEISEEEAKKIFAERLQELNLELKLQKELEDRLILIERFSRVNIYSREIARAIKDILDDEKEIDEKKIRTAKIAAIIHDNGKGGPWDASVEQQIAIIKLYAREDITKEQGKEKVEDMIRQKFSEAEASSMLSELKNLKRNEGILSWTMRDFWDAHIKWGAEVNNQYGEGLEKEAIIIADLHHAYKGLDNKKYNPHAEEEFLEKYENFLRASTAIGVSEEYLSIIVLDLYEAFKHRSNIINQEEAVRLVEIVLTSGLNKIIEDKKKEERLREAAARLLKEAIEFIKKIKEKKLF